MNRRGFLKRLGALLAVPVVGANFSELVPVERPVMLTVPAMPRRALTLREWADAVAAGETGYAAALLPEVWRPYLVDEWARGLKTVEQVHKRMGLDA